MGRGMRKQLFLLALLPGFLSATICGFTPEYYAIQATNERKQTFMEILYPLIKEAHHRIQKERAYAIVSLKLKEHFEPKTEDPRLLAIAKKYRIKKTYDLHDYLVRINNIPESLVLAQAAAESGWGNSRFVKEANNLFGEWTWGEKGLVPSSRESGKKHKIRIFDTLQDSIDSYMLNLNRHYAYAKFRQARFSTLQEGKAFKGKDATKHLDNYSGIGHEYHDLLQGIINYNKMCEYSPLGELLY